MSVQDTPTELWGGETTKAVANFPVSGERVPLPVVRWLGRVKGAAARVNAELGLLDASVAERIAAAGDEIAEGKHDAQFPIDVFQTGSGTSSNMNANEVIAALAGEGAHPNDHVNMGQSSNDVFPSAVHLAALDEATNTLLPALEQLEAAFAAKADAFKDLVKSGRTHLMDAVPVTLGQEFSGLRGADPARPPARRERAAAGGADPARRHGDGHRPEHAPRLAAKVREKLAADTGLTISPPEDPFEAQGNRDALVELSGALKVVAVSLIKIAGDLALMGSGPRVGIGELFLPELQKGSSIMPGKVNPVIPEVVLQVGAQVIGNDTAITIGGLQGQFELNVRNPLIARNLLQSIHCSDDLRLFAEKCVDGIEPNLAGLEASAEGTLAVATALNPYIGYDKAAEIVKDASASGETLRDVARKHGVDEETLDKALDLRKIAAGSSADRPRRVGGYYDAVPRSAARVEAVGPFSLFVGTGPWPYYARPRLGLSHTFTVDDVRAVLDRQRALRAPATFEWVHETTPSLLEAARAAGLSVLEAPLMVLDRGAWRVPEPPAGMTLRVLSADDGALAAAARSRRWPSEPRARRPGPRGCASATPPHPMTGSTSSASGYGAA